jgi:predicted membrane metal-binding protein
METKMEKHPDATHQSPIEGNSRHPTPLQGFGTLGAAIAVVGSFIAASGALGIVDMWVGFLFALYWAGLQRSDFKKLPASFLGAAIGISYAYMLRELPSVMPNGALIVCIVAVIAMVYLQIVGWLSIAVNFATMLFMLVSTIPPIMAGSQYPQQLIALAFGAAYFATVVWIANQVGRRRKSGGAQVAATSGEETSHSVPSK